VFEEIDDPYTQCYCVTQQQAQDMVENGDTNGIEGISFYYMENVLWSISIQATGYGI
jgi:hypothetical protein